MTALDEDTFNSSKLLFDDTAYPYQSQTDNGATYLCGTKRYRPPQAIIEMATARSPGVVRERHGIYVDGAAPVTADPQAPFDTPGLAQVKLLADLNGRDPDRIRA